jgi:hypothetical protein
LPAEDLPQVLECVAGCRSVRSTKFEIAFLKPSAGAERAAGGQNLA